MSDPPSRGAPPPWPPAAAWAPPDEKRPPDAGPPLPVPPEEREPPAAERPPPVAEAALPASPMPPEAPVALPPEAPASRAFRAAVSVPLQAKRSAAEAINPTADRGDNADVTLQAYGGVVGKSSLG